jgi:hypothetical protein
MLLTNAHIELLKKREQEIRAQLTAERAKNQRRAERKALMKAKVVGRVVLDIAAQDPNGFGVMLKSVLNSAGLDERTRAFLSKESLI